MTTFLEFALLAALLIIVGLAMLAACRDHIHRQMDQIAEAANDGAFKRPLRFRAIPALPASGYEENPSSLDTTNPQECATTPAA